MIIRDLACSYPTLLFNACTIDLYAQHGLNATYRIPSLWCYIRLERALTLDIFVSKHGVKEYNKKLGIERVEQSSFLIEKKDVSCNVYMQLIWQSALPETERNRIVFHLYHSSMMDWVGKKVRITWSKEQKWSYYITCCTNLFNLSLCPMFAIRSKDN